MSALVVTCSGRDLDALSSDVVLDIRGPWVAHVELAGDVELTGAVVLTVAGENETGARTFTGTVRRTLPWRGRTRAVFVGGADGLRHQLAPRDYLAGAKPVRVGKVVADIAEQAGEHLAAGVEAALEAFGLPRWFRTGADDRAREGTGAEALDVITERVGLGWRVLGSGELWAGTETWAASAADLGETWIDDEDDGRIDCAPPRAELVPGEVVVTDRERRITRVTYRIRPGEVRAELLYSVTGDTETRPCPCVYRETHAATVVLQNADGTLDLKVDDPRIEGIRSVPFKSGMAGSWQEIEAGERVGLAFHDGDPSTPFSFGLDMTPNALHRLALVSDAIDAGSIQITAPPGGGLCSVVHTPPGGAPSPPSTLTHLLGKITGPGHARVKGVSL